MSYCELCEAGDPSINVRCRKCRETFHFHRRQLEMAPLAGIIMGDCPSCGRTNYFIRWHSRLTPIRKPPWKNSIVLDLRGRR